MNARVDRIRDRMLADGGGERMAADLQNRVRELRLSFGPDWPAYADPDDVMEVQNLANVLGVDDPTEPSVNMPHLTV